MRFRLAVGLGLGLGLGLGCDDEGIATPDPVHLADHVTQYGEAEVWAYFRVDGETTLTVHLDGMDLVLELWVDSIGSVDATIDGETSSSETITWFRPRPVTDETLEVTLTGQGNGKVVIWARGQIVPPIARETGLVWLAPEILDSTE